RRTQCRNNLKQLGIAMHSYHDTMRVLPMGHSDTIWGTADANYGGGWAWSTAILPYLDQAPLYNQFNFSNTPYSLPVNQPLMKTSLATYNCPSDIKPQTVGNNAGSAGSGAGVAAVATTSYQGVFGCFDGDPCNQNGSGPNSVIEAPRNNGVFLVHTCRNFKHITDGLSNVIMVGEVRWIP